MKRIKTVVICVFIVVIILFIITSFEFILLRLLGLQYESFGSLIIFFLIYLFLTPFFSLITDTIPKALKTIEVISSSKGWLSFLLDIGVAYTSIAMIDYFMETIMISWEGTLFFSLISGFIGWKLKETNNEPPMINSYEFQKIEKK
ncbi:YrvL family regulatory protein [Bacillus toyonensis]|uniref:YrvL family regulatory protein n=1 Tax=Bacillus toyonensis TaxID=155322 RepID=UPI003D25C597